MRRISFMHTEGALLAGIKTVTRRLGWAALAPGTRLLAVDKVRGLKAGQQPRALGVLHVTSVRRERLDAITPKDVAREGFPAMSKREFVATFCAAMKCEPSTVVTRIEFTFERPSRAKSASFDYGLDYAKIDMRRRPELYRIGKGEQGVLLVEPYKREILPHWRFKTPAEAERSSATIHAMFLRYLRANDFPGADMARKFLQMGWTRARRYANHRGGRKYDAKSGEELPRSEDPQKARAAAIFYERYVAAREHAEYVKQRDRHRERFEREG